MPAFYFLFLERILPGALSCLIGTIKKASEILVLRLLHGFFPWNGSSATRFTVDGLD